MPAGPLQLFYGGTFDPVHNGHVAIARAARDELGCSVQLMPAADPPHRAAPGADAAQRAHMLDLAVQDQPGLRVDRRELARAGRSYTIDTLRELRLELGPDCPIALLLGADSFIGLPSWHQWNALFDFAHFVVARRPGTPRDGELPGDLAKRAQGRWTSSPAALQEEAAGRLFLLEHPLQHESASEVRRRIGNCEAWRELVPAPVAAFISSSGLYSRRAADPSPL